jgi:lipopolysaccharide biosynthesis regulator YciM
MTPREIKKLDAEMSLLLCECSVLIGNEEFEEHAMEFERAQASMPFMGRYLLARADWLISRGCFDEARAITGRDECADKAFDARRSYILGRLEKEQGSYKTALKFFHKAEAEAQDNLALLSSVYSNLEICYRELSDFKQAYFYAAKQLH